MDTDVEVLKPLDDFLKYEAFAGFETKTKVNTGLMACEKSQKLFAELLNCYNGLHFLRLDGTQDQTTNVARITNICLKYGLTPNNHLQTVNGLTVFPKEFFCPKDIHSGFISKTNNTYTIHHFEGSWVSVREKKWINFERKISKLACGEKIINAKFVRAIHLVYTSGIKGVKWKIKEIIER